MFTSDHRVKPAVVVGGVSGDSRRLSVVSSDSRSSEDSSQPPTANQRSPARCGQYDPPSSPPSSSSVGSPFIIKCSIY